MDKIYIFIFLYQHSRSVKDTCKISILSLTYSRQYYAEITLDKLVSDIPIRNKYEKHEKE